MKASIFVVNVSLQEAKNRLYRREINQVVCGKLYQEPVKITANTVLIKMLTDLGGVGMVLYTHTGCDRHANLTP